MQSAVIVDLSQFEPVSEVNKEELITWLQEQLEVLSDPNYNRSNRNVNRIYGDNQDDIDVTITMLGRFLVTLQNYNLFKK